MSNTNSFLARIDEGAIAGDVLHLEIEAGKSKGFSRLDAFLDAWVLGMLRGEEVVTLRRLERSDFVVNLCGLDDERKAFLADTFSCEAQQARGAWWLPETARVKAGLLLIPSLFQRSPRFALTAADEMTGRVSLTSTPDALCLWALLEPLAAEMFRPLTLRGPDVVGRKKSVDGKAEWEEVDRFYAALGLDMTIPLEQMRYGSGWSRLRAMEQQQARLLFLQTLQLQAGSSLGSRLRALQCQRLAQLYRKKTRGGSVAIKRQAALTKESERLLSGLFGGDWLALLSYLDATPHSDEQVITALPEPRLYVRGDEAKVASIAREQGLPVEAVREILGTFWQGGNSPIEERLDTLKRYWRAFDELHIQQRPGMRSLWGLVEEGNSVPITEILFPGKYGQPGLHTPGLYRDVIDTKILTAIHSQWGTTFLSLAPSRIVTEVFPHRAMAVTFGPALAFWHGAALTAWFLCEGPMSRTDMAGLAHYHRQALAELKALGTPIPETLFAELIGGEARLGQPVPVVRESSTHEVMAGLSMSMTLHSGSRRTGFERLRDIITRHRQDWEARYLDAYLQKRWESNLNEAARLHSVRLSVNGKPPTAKQMAQIGGEASRRWFGGDLSLLCAAIGEPCPLTPERVSLLPADPLQFAIAVYEALGGSKIEADQSRLALAGLAISLTQHQEAFGPDVTYRQAGLGSFQYYSDALGSDIDEAWSLYTAAVERARLEGGKQQSVLIEPSAVQPGRPEAVLASKPMPIPQIQKETPRVSVASALNPQSAPPQKSVDADNTEVDPPEQNKRSWWKRLLNIGRSEQ